MTDLEEAWENPQGDIPAELPVQRPRRKTYNWRELELGKALLFDAREENERLLVQLAEARRQIANQTRLAQSEYETAEHAIAQMFVAKSEMADRARGAVIAYALVGMGSIVAWEIGWSIARWVWR